MPKPVKIIVLLLLIVTAAWAYSFAKRVSRAQAQQTPEAIKQVNDDIVNGNTISNRSMTQSSESHPGCVMRVSKRFHATLEEQHEMHKSICGA
jgi:hypothetical protein